MEVKVFELVENGSKTPVMAVNIKTGDDVTQHFMARQGYGKGGGYTVQLTNLDTRESQFDPYRWVGDDLMMEAHKYIVNSWDELMNGISINMSSDSGDVDSKHLSGYSVDMLGVKKEIPIVFEGDNCTLVIRKHKGELIVGVDKIDADERGKWRHRVLQLSSHTIPQLDEDTIAVPVLGKKEAIVEELINRNILSPKVGVKQLNGVVFNFYKVLHTDF